MTAPFDPCSPIPLGDDFLAGRPSVHHTLSPGRHGVSPGHAPRVPHVHHPVYRAPHAIPPNLGCGAAKWIAGTLGAAGLGGGVVAGDEIIHALSNPPHSDGRDGSGSPFNGWAVIPPGAGWGGGFSAGDHGSTRAMSSPSTPVDVPEPSAALLFAGACLVAILLRFCLQIPVSSAFRPMTKRLKK